MSDRCQKRHFQSSAPRSDELTGHPNEPRCAVRTAPPPSALAQNAAAPSISPASCVDVRGRNKKNFVSQGKASPIKHPATRTNLPLPAPAAVLRATRDARANQMFADRVERRGRAFAEDRRELGGSVGGSAGGDSAANENYGGRRCRCRCCCSLLGCGACCVARE